MKDQDIVRAHAEQLRSFITTTKRQHPSVSDLEASALVELESTVEELNVAEEELRTQHDELLASHYALEKERERFRELFEQAPDPYIETDRAGAIRSANNAALELFGRRADRLEGKPLLIYIPQEDHRLFFTQLDAMIRAPENLPASFDLRIAGRPGSVRHMQARVDMQADGHRLRWLLRDVTDTRRAEQAERQLRIEHAVRLASEVSFRQERFLAAASEALTEEFALDALYDLVVKHPVPYLADACALDLRDDKGHLVRHALHTEEGMEVGDALELLPPDSQAIEECIASTEAQLLAGSDPATSARLGWHARFKSATVLVMPLCARGRLLGTLSIIRMSSDRSCGRDMLLSQAYAQRAAFAIDNARLYDEAASARKMMADMVRILSHEFRTPLTSVLGYADLMLAGISGELKTKQKEYLASMRSSAWNLGRLVDDVLAAFRTGEEPDSLSLSSVDIGEQLTDVSQLAVPVAEGKGLRLTVEMREAFSIRTDAVKLRQILLNLIGNAIKFTESGGVTILAAKRMGGLEVRVVDTGPGITPDDQARIFEEFWQAPGSRRRSGIGLGLALARKLARLLGGDILVESAAGEGSTFTLWIPDLP